MADVTFVTNVDLANNELRNAKAQVLSADPTGVEGKFVYNSTDKQLKFYNGTAWVSGGAAVADLSGQALAFGQTAANGSASTAARSDHYHALPAHNAAAHSAIKLSDLAAPAANLAMGGFKLTGLAAGTANGDSLRYEQVIGQFLALTGGTLSGDLTIDSGLSSTELVVSNGGGSGASLEVRGGVSNIKLGSNDLSPAYWNIKHDHSDSKRFSIERWDGTAKVDTVLSIDNTTGAITSTKTLAMGNNKITGLADGTASTDAVTKQQLDAATSAAAAGLDFKQSVRLATTTNINLSNFGTGNVDGIGTVAGQRVLVKNQTNKAENGIYTVGGSAWTRATDFDSSTEVTAGAFVFVEEGTTQADTGWVLTTDGAITVGTTQLDFTQFSGVGSWTWGNGLSNTLNTVNVGAGTGISVAADTVGIDTSVVPRKYSTTLSGTAASQTVTHNLGTQDVVVSVRRTADNVVVYTGVTAATTNTVTIDFASTVTANAYRVTVMA